MSKRTRHQRRTQPPASPKPQRSAIEKIVTSGAVAAGLAVLTAPGADAATFTVTNTTDGGAGSLRDAIASANSTPGADVITFNPTVTGTITLTSGQLYISDSVDVQGPGAAALTVSGNNSSRVFYVYTPGNAAPINVTISGLTIANGAANIGAGIVDFGENLTLDKVVVTNNVATGPGGGVAKASYAGTLTVLNSTISGNSGTRGGGVYLYDNDQPALIEDSIISGNQASGSGGGMYFYGPNYDVLIRRTTISGNTAGGNGGGVYFYDTDGGSIYIQESTISGNSASYNGGGIYFYNVDNPVTITNTTISGNTAVGAGGGVYFYGSGAPFTVEFSTIAANSAGVVGGNFEDNGNAVTLNNSIIADGIAPTNPDVDGGTFTSNYSLIETIGTAVVVQNTGTLTGVDPQLGPLQNNGGTTATRLPALTSPVINAGDPAFVPPPAIEQRGFARVAGGRVDMGAVEVQGGTIDLSSATYTVAENGGSVTITVNRTGGTDPASVNYATSNGTATAGSDYTTTSGTLNFLAGQTTATFNVPILDDTLVEGNETFNVTLSSPSPGATLGTQTAAVVTITDFEPGHLQFNSSTGSVNEAGGSITITVTRSGGSDGAVSANYSTSNGTATAGSDYTATAGTVNFANGDSAPKSFNVPITNDAIVEGNETFNVNLSMPAGGATIGTPSTETVTIVDATVPGSVQFSTAVNTVAESAGTVTLTITRTGGSGGPLTVNYSTSNGTATAPQDYTASTGSVTFLNGDTTPKTINIPIVSDTIPEPPESFIVTLSMPSAGTLGPQSTTTVTITPPLEEIPVLGTIGKLLLALSTMASALWMMGRRRLFGFLLAAAMLGLMTGNLSAATQAATATAKPLQPVVRAKAGGHNPHNLAKNKTSGVIAEVQSSDKNTTLKLTNGTTIAIATPQLSVSLNGGTASVGALAAGQRVTIVTMTDQMGNVKRIKVKIKH
jgi:parallel beta-helix repeat protein